MNLKEFNQKYGRQTLIALAILVWVYIIWSFFVNGYINTWYQWNIPAKEPPFIDFRLIPSGAETFRSGGDPSVSNPSDPRGHIFNYPKIWYIFFYTGITQADTIWLSVLLIVLFFFTVFFFAERLSVVDAVLTLMVVFSPAAMLLYERGNVDLAFFTLCGLAVIFLTQSPSWSVAILWFAAMFKFFPFFGVGIFLQENRNRFYKYFLVSLFLFLIYVAVSFESLVAAWKLTERGTIISYGVYIIFDLLKSYFRYYLLKVLSSDIQVAVLMKWLPHITAALYLVVIFFFGMRTKEPYQTDSERNLTAFRMGALIYIGTFLLGNNWDYRLAFLIFTIPQLSRWTFSINWRRRWAVLVTFLSLFLSCWYIVVNHQVMMSSEETLKFQMDIFDEVMNWILFGGLTYLVFASAPQWFRTFAWFGRSDQQV